MFLVAAVMMSFAWTASSEQMPGSAGTGSPADAGADQPSGEERSSEKHSADSTEFHGQSPVQKVARPRRSLRMVCLSGVSVIQRIVACGLIGTLS